MWHLVVFITSVILLGALPNGVRCPDVDYEAVFDMNASIQSMGDAIFLKNEHVCSGDIEIRHEHDFEKLRECTVIEGDLVIATLNMRHSRKKWEFPRLKEITGKLIVYYTNLKQLNMFPNLVVIRGRQPILGYSLVIMDTILTHMHLPSLRLVQNGGVRLTKNHVMCHVHTIHWSNILNYRTSGDQRSLQLIENNRGICPDLCNQSMRCPTGVIDEKKKELCWSPNVCQSICSKRCPMKASCWMNDTERCCDNECLGGCYGNGTELCVSCRNFLHQGRCVESCPEGFYEYLDRRCISKEKCFAKVANDPIYYKRNITYSIYNGKCVDLCPPQHRRNDETGVCYKCVPKCPKRCGDAYIYGLKESNSFWGCSSVRRLHISIRDGGEAEKLIEQLKKNFGDLEVVEEYVKIINTGALKTLSFLSNLREIGARNKNSSAPTHASEPPIVTDPAGKSKKNSEHNVFEVVANDRLESLWTSMPRRPVKIFGRVSIHLNRQLCANKILDFLDNQVQLMAGNLSEQERTFIQRANGDLMPCNVSTINLTIAAVTARNVDVKWAQVDLNDRNLFVTLLMIKPTTKNISLADDRASCEKSSWQIHEATACPKTRDGDRSSMQLVCTLTVPKLTPATRYAVYMESKTTQGDHGAVSPVVYFSTKSQPPTAPRDIQIEALSASSLKMTWYPPRHPNGVVTRYLIWYRPMKLIKQEFSGRDFCASKLMGHQQARTHSNPDLMKRREQSPNKNSNSSVCTTCEECLRSCGDKSSFFKNTEDVSHSFEDSLQNHIFVKRPGISLAAIKHGNGLGNGTGTNSSVSNSPFITTVKSEGSASAARGRPAAADPKAPETSETTDSPGIPAPTTATEAPRVMLEREEEEDKENKTQSQFKCENQVTVLADQTSYIFTNLQHFTEYIFAIRACQDPPQDSNGSGTESFDDIYPSDDDMISGGYNAKVCSKMTRATHRTLPSDEADRVDDTSIEVNKESGLRVLWSKPKNPNGMVLLYWFRYRKIDPDAKKKAVSINNWNWLCVPLRDWYIYYRDLERHRTQTQSQTMSQSPRRRSIIPPNDEEDSESVENAAMFADRGGCLCSGSSFSPGQYEFAIKAVSLAGNGSWTKTFSFEVEGDVRTKHDVILNVILPVLSVMMLLLLSVIAPLFFFFRRKARQNAQEVIFSNPEYQKLPQPDEWEISPSDVVLYSERALGKGHFGVVVKGFVKNLKTPAAGYFQNTDTVLAAVKMVRKESSFQEKLEFLSEANRMKTFHSHHIVQLLGVVSRMDTRDARPQVVMEFMSHGDLNSYLHQISEKEGICMLPEMKILLWAAQIADGMAYLSSHRVVHRDLAARNCLVDAHEVVKIADFGLTRELYYTEEAYKKRRSRGGVLGPFMWMAPESLARGNFSSQSDVWSYGVVLWEIATLGARPYPNMGSQAVKDYVLGGSNLLTRDDLWDNSWKKLCPLFVMELMRQCFQFHDKNRPTFLDILLTLDPYVDERFIKYSFYVNRQQL